MIKLVEDGVVLKVLNREVDDEILLVRWLDILFMFDGADEDGNKTFRKVECETL